MEAGSCLPFFGGEESGNVRSLYRGNRLSVGVGFHLELSCRPLRFGCPGPTSDTFVTVVCFSSAVVFYNGVKRLVLCAGMQLDT